MCQVRKRVYVATDGTVEQTFVDNYPCTAKEEGRVCSDVKELPNEFYDQATDTEEEDSSDSKESDMETEVGEGTRRPPPSKSPKRIKKHGYSHPPSEGPSSIYYSAKSDAYFSVASKVTIPKPQQK
jgi:hypothetical protein